MGEGSEGNITLKRRGLRTAPCGTPFSIDFGGESRFPILTRIIRFKRKFLSHARMGPGIPSLVVLYRRPWVHTES